MVAPGILSRRRLPGLLLLVPTVIAGVVALVAGLREHSDRPSDAALVAAVATVRSTITAQRVTADAGTTDAVIVIAPPWSMRPLVALGPLAAIAVPADGPWADLVAGRFARIFVIVEPDAEPWLRGRPLLASARTVGDDGAVSVLQIDSVAARFDMRARLNDATIRLHRSADAADDDPARLARAAAYVAAQALARYLAALGEPTDAPTRAPARAPPYWKSRVLRRAAGDEAAA